MFGFLLDLFVEIDFFSYKSVLYWFLFIIGNIVLVVTRISEVSSVSNIECGMWINTRFFLPILLYAKCSAKLKIIKNHFLLYVNQHTQQKKIQKKKQNKKLYPKVADSTSSKPYTSIFCRNVTYYYKSHWRYAVIHQPKEMKSRTA